MISSFYFKESEFQQCTPPCSLQNMNQSLINRIDALRAVCGFPLILNSAFRSINWEKSKGRSGSSSHTTGLAIDIHCKNEQKRFFIVKYALQLGFTRIGIAPTYIHLDIDTGKTQNITWLY